MLCVTENSVSLDAVTVSEICTYRKLSILFLNDLEPKGQLFKHGLTSV